MHHNEIAAWATWPTLIQFVGDIYKYDFDVLAYKLKQNSYKNLWKGNIFRRCLIWLIPSECCFQSQLCFHPIPVIQSQLGFLVAEAVLVASATNAISEPFLSFSLRDWEQIRDQACIIICWIFWWSNWKNWYSKDPQFITSKDSRKGRLRLSQIFWY